MPTVTKREKSISAGKWVIPVVMGLAIAALAATVVVQGVQIHKIKQGHESQSAQNAERAETIERQTKQLEEQMQELEELRRQKGELEQLTRQQTERLAALEAQVRAAAAATTNTTATTSSDGYSSLYPDFYAPQAYSANSAPSKTAYLTFDDGPSGNTDVILQTLQEENVKATFFVVGTTDANNLARMRRIVQEGHTIGMHSYSHSYKKIYASVEAFLKDMYQVFNLIKDTTGVTPT